MDIFKIINTLKTDWKDIILTQKDQLEKINKFINKDREDFKEVLEIFPPNELIFNAFSYFNSKDLKVVIIGQDCYHRKGQANGLCFSVPENIKIPPSLRNILKEMKSDINSIIQTSDFTYLAKQGILLLNSALTVREKSPSSHIKIWKSFTDNIINYISNNCSKIIFVLWGTYAKNKSKLIDTKKHYILTAHHPSPLSANRGGWFGCKHFSQINKILLKNNKSIIKW
tara:strand:- start:809 stop:1489 length:681 start_codon:yes stop_codon:yes gene_type:complete